MEPGADWPDGQVTAGLGCFQLAQEERARRPREFRVPPPLAHSEVCAGHPRRSTGHRVRPSGPDIPRAFRDARAVRTRSVTAMMTVTRRGPGRTGACFRGRPLSALFDKGLMMSTVINAAGSLSQLMAGAGGWGGGGSGGGGGGCGGGTLAGRSVSAPGARRPPARVWPR